MKKLYAVFIIATLCAVSLLPLTVVQSQSETALDHRAEISFPIHRDKTPKPLREMFDTGEPQKPARGGKDFEPGRPQPVTNVNKESYRSFGRQRCRLAVRTRRSEGFHRRHAHRSTRARCAA